MERGFLIIENLFSESRMELLTENSKSGKKLFLEGPMVMCNRVNRNGRHYSKELVGIPMVERYNEEYINEGRAIGECEHPEYPFPKMKEAAVLLKEKMTWVGDDAVSKMEILDNPFGQVVRSLAEAGYRLGASTRGLGSSSRRDGIEEIDPGFMMTAVDVVDRPSGQTCYMNAVVESVEWVQESDGSWRPSAVKGQEVDKLMKNVATMAEAEEFCKRFKAAINGLS